MNINVIVNYTVEIANAELWMSQHTHTDIHTYVYACVATCIYISCRCYSCKNVETLTVMHVHVIIYIRDKVSN